MNAEMMQAQAAQSRLNLTNQWVIRVDRELCEAAEAGWPKVNIPELLGQPEEVQERVMGHYRDRGYQVYRGVYGDGWDTIWFSSERPKVKEPGVISQVLHRLFGGSTDRI